MNKLGKVVLFNIFALLFSSCLFSGLEGDVTVVDVSDPNPAWVSIEVPTSEPTYTTSDDWIENAYITRSNNGLKLTAPSGHAFFRSAIVATPGRGEKKRASRPAA